MLVGPKCGAHILCGPSFDGPDCASAHDQRIAVTGLSGGQQRGCAGPASRAGLAHSLHLAAAGRAGAAAAWSLKMAPARGAQPPLASAARPRIPGPGVNDTQARNLAVL
jgi:hypothetical protein